MDKNYIWIDLPRWKGIPKPIQSWTGQSCTAIVLIKVFAHYLVTLFLGILPQGFHLALDSSLPLLTVGGYPCVDNCSYFSLNPISHSFWYIAASAWAFLPADDGPI